MPRGSIPPSYHQGFARHIGESAYPEFWKELVGAWAPALGVTGNTLRDLSGFSNHGTLENMDPEDWVIDTSPTVGSPHMVRPPGYALNFDGDASTERVNIGASSHFNITDRISVMAWVKPVLMGTDAIISKRQQFNVNIPWDFYIHQSAGPVMDLQIRIHDGTANDIFQSTSLLTLDGWNHVAFTFDKDAGSGNFIFYVNGKAGGTGTRPEAMPTNSIGVFLGMEPESGGADFFNGRMNDIRVYRRVLSPAEIERAYHIPLAPFRLRRRMLGKAPAAAVGYPAAYYDHAQHVSDAMLVG